jgi:hypothetical protein
MKRNSSAIIYILLSIVFAAIVYSLVKSKEGFDNLTVGKWKVAGSTSSLDFSTTESNKQVIINSDTKINGTLEIGDFIIKQDGDDLVFLKKGTSSNDEKLKIFGKADGIHFGRFGVQQENNIFVVRADNDIIPDYWKEKGKLPGQDNRLVYFGCGHINIGDCAVPSS